jgi:hypothetical protein
MTSPPSLTDPRPIRRAPSGWFQPGRAGFWLMVCACLCTLALPGCSGCRKTNQAAKKKAEEEEAEKKKKKKQELPPYEVTQLTSYPDDPDQVQNFVKPGHWVTMTEQMRANQFDFQADFELAATDRDGQPFLVENTDFHLRLSRPISLPKGQIRTLELTTYVPRVPRTNASGAAAGPTEAKRVWFEGKLRAARGGKQVSESREATTEMLDHEYFLVVLAKEPNNYRFLKVLDSIAPPAHGEDGGRKYHYRVIIPVSSEFVPIPSHPLTWTSIAYMVWDDIDPNSLSTEQQQALLDWIHWGGQLVVSGPGSLDTLKASFLAPFLPAESSGGRDLGADELKELDEKWSLPSVKMPQESRRIELKGKRPLLGVTLVPRPEAQVVPGTGGLVYERRVGGGRIVVSALPLGDESIRNWKSFDNFLNGCLLRRPGRDFRSLADINDDNAQPEWVGFDRGLAADPRLMTGIRYFTRDIGSFMKVDGDSDSNAGDTADAAEPRNPVSSPVPTPQPGFDLRLNSSRTDQRRRDTFGQLGIYSDLGDYRFGGTATDRLSGVGGWNDGSGVSLAVLDTIKEAAGITIPEARFVLKMMAVYLALLVPVNWTVFRLMGRVEWAWIAVPILAIGGAVMVIRMAQLDIGFVRSRREVSVMEIQGGYDRAHLTRYALLYSSLSTEYDVTFADPSAVAQPFSKGSAPQAGMYASSRSVSFRRDDQVRLRDFLVNSNSTELLHSEQMQPLNGPLELVGDEEKGWELHNHGDLSLNDVGLVRRRPEQGYEAAWLGTVAPRTKMPVKFTRTSFAWVSEWDQSKVLGQGAERAEGEMNLSRFAELAVKKMQLQPGGVRLVGWTDEELAGVAFKPAAAQNSTRTIVVAHLLRGELPPIAGDVNVRTDFFAPKPLENEEEGND